VNARLGLIVDDQLIIGAVWYVVFLLSTSFHEAAHAFTAKKYGDLTAYNAGQTTLLPWPHIRREPIGMVVAPLISFLIGGWMFGWASCPRDPEWARRNPSKETLMSLAGPFANLLIVVISGILIWIGIFAGFFYAPDAVNFDSVVASHQSGMAKSIALMLSIAFTLNLFLFAFNMIPLPPLDGSSLLKHIIPKDSAHFFYHAMSNPAFAITGLIISWKCFNFIADPLQCAALNLLYPGSYYH